MNNLESNDFLAKEKISKLILKLGTPVVCAQIFNLLYSVIDRIYIGHMDEVGALALTGVGLCSPIVLLISAFASLVCAGGGPHAAIFLGEGNHKAAEETMGTCFALQCVLSILITLLLVLFDKQILLATGASSNTLPYALDYMSIYEWGTPFAQLTLGMSAFVSAQGFTRYSMIATIVGAVINIVLDPIFIFSFGLGVKGAAIATVISQSVSCFIIVAFLLGKKTVLHLSLKTIKVRKKYLISSVSLGFATFIMQITETVLSFCFNTSLLKYGGDIAVGSLTIMGSISRIMFFPIQGLTQGAQPITSFNYGAGDYNRVKESITILTKYCFIWAFSFWLFSRLFTEQLVKIFTSDILMIEYTAEMYSIYSLVSFTTGLQMPCQMSFVALGKSGCSVISAIVRKVIILIPMIYILPEIMHNGVKSVFLAEPVSDFLAVTFTVILFIFVLKKTLKRMRESRVVEK